MDPLIILAGAAAVLGAVLSWRQGRDPVSWAVICGITLGAGVVYLLVKGPVRARRGCSRPCAVCGRLIRWKAARCRACGTSAVAGERRRVLDLSGPVYDAWWQGMFPWMGWICGIGGLLAVLSFTPVADVGALACYTLVAGYLAAGWGLHRRKAPAARAVVVLGACAAVLGVAFVATGGNLEIYPGLFPGLILAWIPVRTALAVLRPRQEDDEAYRALLPWARLAADPPAALAPPSRRVPTDPERHSGRVFLRRLFAVVLVVLGGAVMAAGDAPPSILIFACMLAVMNWRHGTRLASLSGSELRARDPRRPVVFFRSFEDEALLADPGFLDAFQISKPTVEMLIAGVGWRCGPVITCGSPRLELPPLGFARDALGHADWQATAVAWMDEARLIFLMVGRTSGIGWEMNAIGERGGLQRLVLVLPPLSLVEERRFRWNRFVAQLDAPVQARLSPLVIDRALAIVFTADGQPLMLTASRHGAQGYACALEAAAGYVLANTGALAAPPGESLALAAAVG